jgi:hypothetical protein
MNGSRAAYAAAHAQSYRGALPKPLSVAAAGTVKPPLAWHVGEDARTAVLEGVIDEYANLAELGDRMSGPTIHLDLSGIERVSLLGARYWTLLMRSLANREVVLQRCPPVVVEQLCTTRDFRGHASVESVLLPYRCARCHTRVAVELALEGARALPPAPACADCGQPRTFDDDAERYLGLRAHAGLAPAGR